MVALLRAAFSALSAASPATSSNDAASASADAAADAGALAQPGQRSVTWVPSPSTLVYTICASGPKKPIMRSCTFFTAMPRPVDDSTCVMFAQVSSVMPTPSSLTTMTTSSPSASAFTVMVSLPSEGMACLMAFSTSGCTRNGGTIMSSSAGLAFTSKARRASPKRASSKLK